MPSETAVLSLPFPEGADAADGPSAVQALAERIEELLLGADEGVGGWAPGDFKDSAQTASHGRWLLCDQERELSQAEIETELGLDAGQAAELVALLGTGASSIYGDAATGKVKVPGYRGVVPLHQSPSHPKKGSGSSGGEETHTLTTAELPAHTHGAGTLEADAHNHGSGSYAGAAHTHGAGTLGVASHSHGVGTLATAAAGGHDHGGSTAAAGGHNHGGSTGSEGAHTHGVGTLATASGGSHNHGGSTGSTTPGATGTSGAHDHGGATEDESDHYHGIASDQATNTSDVNGSRKRLTDLNYLAASESDSYSGNSLGNTTQGSPHSHAITAAPTHTHTSAAHTHSISSDGAHTHSLSGATAAGSAHTHSISSVADHSHTISSVADHTHALSGSTGSSAPAVTGATASSGVSIAGSSGSSGASVSGDSASVGDGDAHNNMPPYRVKGHVFIRV